MSLTVVVHACNHSYSGGRDQEKHSLKPSWTNNSHDLIVKIYSTQKGLVEQLKQEQQGPLPQRHETLSSNPRVGKKLGRMNYQPCLQRCLCRNNGKIVRIKMELNVSTLQK
jgi:hypothetical protein